jgi:vancomycin resistance protein YoaR
MPDPSKINLTPLAAAAVPATSDGPPRRTRRAALIAGVSTVVALGLVLGGTTAVGASDAVPRGTHVLGIDIGGRAKTEAAEALLRGVGARLGEPVTVTVGPTMATIHPEDVGLHLDAPATVDRAASGWPNPFGVIFGREVEPVVGVDADRLDAALAKPLRQAHGAAKPAAVTFSGLTPKPTYPEAGKVLDIAGAAEAVRNGWLRTGTIAAPATERAPLTTAADVDRLMAELARPAVAAPVIVVTPKGKLTIRPNAIAKSLVIKADEDGKITPRVDEKKLRSAIADDLAAIEVEPHDATVRRSNGESKIVASTGGTLVDTAKLSHDLLGVLPKAAPRSVSASMTIVAAKTTASDLANLGIVEQVSSFTTHFTGGQDRNRNIIQVAKEVDGAILEPGQTFSLNGYTGPRGYAEGYVDAPVLINGRLVNAVGGGISQFTTTLFNAMYYAGLEDVYHQPHSYYFSRYPSVIESTIFYPSLDMKFRNDSPHGVLIDTSYTDDSITVSMWSTKRYHVSTEWGPKRDITYPTTKHLADQPGCIATKGIDGFTQDAWRIFEQDGQVIRREKFSHRYEAEPRFVCDR